MGSKIRNLKKKPEFKKKSQFARYIDEVNRGAGNRCSSSAYLPNPSPPKETSLSVNSLEIESIKEIINYYSDHWGVPMGKVAVHIRQIQHYNSAAKHAGIDISYSSSESVWKFDDAGYKRDAYKHRPVKLFTSSFTGKAVQSYSHCGVEYIEIFNELMEKKFARRMVSGQKYHLY